MMLLRTDTERQFEDSRTGDMVAIPGVTFGMGCECTSPARVFSPKKD